MRARLLRPALAGLAMTGLWVLAAAGPSGAEDLSVIQGAFLRGEYEAVVRETGRRLSAGESGGAEILYLRGVSALKLRDWEMARAALNRLVDEQPASPWAPHAWLALSDTWMWAGQPARALEVLERVLREGRVGQLTPQALFRLGKVQRELGLWDAARASFEQVVRAAPDSAEAGQAKGILAREDFFFCVQVGSFVTRANAERLTRELRRRGYTAEVSEAVMSGKMFHRVRIGRYAKRSEAEEESRRLEADGFPARIFP